jgi:tyrosine-protein kinase Etk/Wzc
LNDFSINAMPVRGSERSQLSATEIFRLLGDHVLEVFAVTAVVTALAITYLFVATPIYDADVLVRVDPPEPNALGIASQAPVSAPPAPSPEEEMAVMASRSVLDPVIARYHFDITITPRSVPLLGALASKFATPGQPAAPWLGLRSFAWGGEQVQVQSLEVPHSLEEKNLKLVALEDGGYALYGPGGDQVLSGKVGVRASASNGVSILVSQLVARPGTQFDVKHWNMIDTIKRFTNVLKISNKAKDTGLVAITYSDKDPAKAAEVANALSQQYIATAVTARQLNDSTTLAFIEKELPRLRADLANAEQALSDYQKSSESLQPTSEAQAYLQGGIDFDRQIANLQIQRTQLLERYTPDSRWVANIDAQLKQIESAKHAFDARFAGMPASQRKSVDLTRDAKVAETIYLGMMQKAEELSVRRASTTGGAHIVDSAVVPFRPVKPEALLVLPGGVTLGLVCGACFVFFRRHVMTGVTDPTYVERTLSVPMMGEVLLSPQQARLGGEVFEAVRRAPAFSRAGPPHRYARATAPGATAARVRCDGVSKVLAHREPDDPSIEALRYVRTVLSRDLAHAQNNVVMVTGPTPAAGKSFIAANLAVLYAEAGLRVLLIDADMRSGHLAYGFGQANSGGLSEVLTGGLDPHVAVRETGIKGLALMSRGSYSYAGNPAALLMKPAFSQMLQRFSDEFDLVVVDTPPFLAVADASIVASKAGSTVLVLRSGLQSEAEIAETVKKLERSEARIAGAVFNGVPLRRSTRYYGYGYGSRSGATLAPDAAA